VCDWLVEAFGLTLPQTSPHYNFALQVCRGTIKSDGLEAHPELVQGLGRPLDKIGGRKKNNAAPAEESEAAVDAVEAEAAEPVVEAVAEPVVEAVAEPVVEPVVEAAAEPVVAQAKTGNKSKSKNKKTETAQVAA
jgi:hypothetical protein